MQSRQAGVEINYRGTDITADLKHSLLTFSYTDNASGSADDVSLSIADSNRRWINKWIFEQGDTLTASIFTKNWRYEKDNGKMPCGTFIIDEPEYKGRPSVISLKGISTPANSSFMNVKRSKVWKSVKLKSIAKDIASRYGLGLFFDSPKNPTLSKCEQSDTADAAFLQQICEEEGFAFKVNDTKIIIFDESTYEKKNAVARFREWNDNVLGYSFKKRTANTAYAGVSVKYLDPKSKRLIEYLYALGEVDEKKDKIYRLNQRVATLDEAMRLARSKLRALNKREIEATLDVLGNIRLAASSTIEIEGFGSFDGKYYIDRASHTVGTGYTTSIEMHKVLEGY